MKIGKVILSAVALFWGLAVVLTHVLSDSPTAGGSGAYTAGRTAAVVLALVLALAGARGLYQEIRRARAG